MTLKMNRNLFFLLFVCSISYAQMEQYNYKMELDGITDPWHKITLPNSVFEQVNNSLYDIRIFGINANNDTIEAPYLLKRKTKKTEDIVVSFKKLNETYTKGNYYITFEVPSDSSINLMELDFEQDDFDWKLKLEGSQNNNEWFEIVDDYRILSIKNKISNYKFTKISFPNSKYKYYRIHINTLKRPKLISAKLDLQKSTPANYRVFPTIDVQTNNNRSTKKTSIEITLEAPVPVSHISLDIQNSFDYYRPITIQYLTDSIKTEQGWKYNYRTLRKGTLSSMEKDGFAFESTILQKIKVIIINNDNVPLQINSVKVKGYVHEIVARFSEPANYYLTYGKRNPVKPNYDIAKFENSIPKNLTTLTLKDMVSIHKKNMETTEPLFKNKLWLWVVMGVIILVLGWFSIKMIKQ
ncbi:MAG: DUF3999 family protein [Flavobacteriaceae bacterium]|nr:DUF3999 family protein [Flavobacteriaceae bacterium]